MFPQLLGSQDDMAKVYIIGEGDEGDGWGCPPPPMESRRPSGLRKTKGYDNSLAHRTTWLRSDLTGRTPTGPTPDRKAALSHVDM